ncbi:MAG: nickel pincer cofactor biosynthesis protein LarC [Eubacterium sp.]|nr:nickel pincer cofactor biosynthesis protein LarC [Eubacterium sp.]
MKTLYIECNMGAAGDMLMGALSEVAPEEAVQKVQNLGIDTVSVTLEHGEKCGVGGTHARVLVDGEEEESADHHHHHDHDHDHHHDHDHGHEHHHHDHDHDHDHHHHDHDHDHHHHHAHHGMADITAMIEGLAVSDTVKANAKAIYAKIAAAESKVHGEPVDQIHFHEVGAMDAVADVVANCVLMEAIGADHVVVSPVNVGSGHVHCAHGVLPVPAPATAEILKGLPYYSDEIKGELLTPTGAAILAHFADEFGPRPVMSVEKNGIGMGTKDFPKANIVRVFLGEEQSAGQSDEKNAGQNHAEKSGQADPVVELSANIDDMTGEDLGFAMEQLLKAGALDVWYTPIMMKKNRPAVMLSCLVKAGDADGMAEVLFKHTTTAGIRKQTFERYTLARTVTEEDGVRMKEYQGYGVARRKAEYDDLAAIAEREGKSLAEVRRTHDAFER